MQVKAESRSRCRQGGSSGGAWHVIRQGRLLSLTFLVVLRFFLISFYLLSYIHVFSSRFQIASLDGGGFQTQRKTRIKVCQKSVAIFVTCTIPCEQKTPLVLLDQWGCVWWWHR
ncbi:hypothetical protein CONLIGDRAFT_172552 [Coniochaeta ligniaria NRRL 30616]|uniref:Uncharacterized protein n=1 Tax=Coniochaeta ligniaria NRRL 30616 TaxID=1408157 RepID=A0A1J7JTL1_9PEZI|nr:hypothetical protein CONLIGDRAFT_172552 [Coniochaeta ligniaria NRRL 30616]